jgi:multiple sugar transport system substrate-binding protein
MNALRTVMKWPNPGRIRLRLAVLVPAALAMTVMLAACGAISPGSSSGSASAVHLEYWTMWTGRWLALIQQEATDFNETHPGIQVSVLSVPQNGDQKLLTAIAAGQPPDIFTEWNPTIGTFAQNNAIIPLNQFATGQYKNAISDLNPSAAAGGTYKGKLYGYPISMNSYLLYYNKDLMKAAGLNPNDPPETLAQLTADQAKEWNISGGRVQQMGFYPPSFSMLAGAFNVHVMKSGNYQLTNNPQALAEMKFIQSYSKYPYSAVNGFSEALDSVGGGSSDAFDVGKQGFTIGGPWEITQIESLDPAMHWGAIPIPAPVGGNSDVTMVNGNYDIIPKGAAHPEQAWTFVAWMAGINNAKASQFLTTGGWMPAVPSVAEQPGYQQWLNQVPVRHEFLQAFNNPKDYTDPLACNGEQYSTDMGNAVEAVLSNTMNAEQALASLQSNIDKATC